MCVRVCGFVIGKRQAALHGAQPSQSQRAEAEQAGCGLRLSCVWA